MIVIPKSEIKIIFIGMLSSKISQVIWNPIRGIIFLFFFSNHDKGVVWAKPPPPLKWGKGKNLRRGHCNNL